MASLEAGRQLADRYVLKERLGDGGHAEVWSALDERTQTLVALKFLHLRSCTPEEALVVLRHEARMAQQLDHPGVLRVEDPQRDGDYVFLPVEYASGGSAARLRGAPWRRSLPVLLDVARVLDQAHARGVIHRDIKPGNVLFDGTGAVRVADFGTSAHTGSCDAPATGSPFSASPQQLRDEAASPSDDVYGLGALAYELLTRYPPFYPQFDAVRVQAEDPPRPVPAQPAPEALLDLVQAMLVRDAAARPSLGAVIEAFEGFLAQPETDAEAVLIEAAPVRTQEARARLRVPVWTWLAGAVAAGVAVLVLMPRPGAKGALLADPVASSRPAVTSVADAVVVAPATSPAASSASTASSGTAVEGAATPVEATAGNAAAADAPQPPTLEAELQAARRALEEYQPAAARAAFQRALALQPGDATAKEGLAAATRLEGLLADLAAATQIEAAGNLVQARERFRLLAANQPDFQPARTALARVEERLADDAFENHLRDAAESLRVGAVDAAAASYESAALLRPRDARVLEGQRGIAAIRLNEQNALDLATGAALESSERWDEAVAHYRAVLQRDAALNFAQDGLARSERRAALDRELADYASRPERLTAVPVRQAAQRAVARAEATLGGSPRLGTQVNAVRTALSALDQPVSVELNSDNSTQVTVSKVGELGVFQTRALTLPPGQYTVIGRRDGFRDVRYELNLVPGQRETVVSIRCTERI